MDLHGKGIKGPCMTFGYPPLSPLKPLLGQTSMRAHDLKFIKRPIGRDALPKQLTGEKGYQPLSVAPGVLLSANGRGTGPPAISTTHGGFLSAIIGSSVYHGKNYHPSMKAQISQIREVEDLEADNIDIANLKVGVGVNGRREMQKLKKLRIDKKI